MNTLRRSWKWLLLLALVAGLVARSRLVRVPVLAHTATHGPLTAEVMGTGTLEARVKTTLSPRIQERLAEVLVDQGDAITNGQLLARLDDGEQRQQVAVAEATVVAARATVERVRADQARAEAVLRQARLDHQRVEELVATKVTSQADFDKAAETLKVAEADLRRSQASIAEAQSQAVTTEKNLLYQKERLTFTELRSPYDGLVVSRDRDPGGVVVPGSSVLQLAATNEIWVAAWVDETAAAQLAPDQSARVVFRSQPGHDHHGKVARLGRETDRETREFLVDVRVDTLPPNWTFGQRAEVFIGTQHKDEVVTVPETFLTMRDGRRGVLVEDGGHARWRPISTGLSGAGSVEVLEGLKEGERVLRPADGLATPLRDGQRIKIP
ncbi:MAG: efflux RND transporter periplasmic adaptor subunit [Verrucomicrobiales bacterium]|nr:efflux RND transporter periplasmic adaptor subunit [Verrucomicrobiales bacterium]